MLTFVRKQQKSVLIKIAFAVIILSFIVGYAMLTSPGDSGNGSPDSVGLRINGEDVTMDAYQQAYGNLYRIYQNVYRDQFTPALEKQLKLREQARDQLIDQALLLEEADRRGLSVSSDELVDAIAKQPAFQENGVFSKNRYLQILAYQRMTPEQYEALEERQLLMQKVQDQLQEGVTVSDAEIAEEYKVQNEKVNLAFVRFAPGIYETRVKVDDAALESYFKEHIEDFRIPDKVALNFITFKPEAYAEQVTLDEAEIEKYYQRHLAQFDIPEQVKAAHVLIRVASDADEKTRADKKALAEKVLAEAKSGKDFADLARKYSDDKASVAKGGDLGFFTRGTMVTPFETAAFALKPGEISDVVETPFGYHVIKAEGYIEAGIKPLAEVVEQVKQGLRDEKARQLAYEKAMDAYNINRKSGDLKAAADANGLSIDATGLFARGDSVSGLGSNPEISDAAFALASGELARPVSLPQGVVLFGLKERVESHLPELADVRAKVEQAYRRSRGQELADQAAAKLLAELKDGKALEKLAKQENLKLEETGDFTRSYGDFVPRIGNAEGLAKTAFELTDAAPVAPQVYELSGTYLVAALKSRTESDPDGLTAGKQDELRTSLLARKQQQAITDKLDALKSQAEIMISPALQSLLNEG